MAVTHEELNDFQRFVIARLANCEAESMTDLVAAWESERQHQQSIDALKESHADAEAGRVVPAEEVFLETRKTLGITE